MSAQTEQIEINPKKYILSTTEVSKLLLSKGRRKINDSILSHGGKITNNVDLTDLTSQINLKLSKDDNPNMTLALDQTMFRPFGEKSVMYNKQRSNLDKTGFYRSESYNMKDSHMNSNNYISKVEKSQSKNGIEVAENKDIRNKKKFMKLDSNEIIFDKFNSMKISNIINNYFPYENENNLDIENNSKLKNFLIIFYFIIDNSTFVLIKKLDKRLNPSYFWNREEDAKKFGLNYSQVNTPGLYFKNYENFKEFFKYHGINFTQTIDKLKNLLVEKKKEYDLDIENYKMKIKELNEENEKLKEKLNEYDDENNLKNLKIQELSDKLNEINEEMDELKLINEKLKNKIKKLKNNTNNNKENINNNQKNEEKMKKGNNKVLKNFLRSKTKMDINPDKNLKKKQNKYLSDKVSELNKYYYENHNSETKNEKDELSSDDDNSFPKLEDYNIENDEDEKINKIRTISNIKTYGERKRYYQNFNSVNNNTPKNNVFITIKDSSDKNGKNFTETYKNKYQSETLDYNKDKLKNNNSSNKFNFKKDS